MAKRALSPTQCRENPLWAILRPTVLLFALTAPNFAQGEDLQAQIDELRAENSALSKTVEGLLVGDDDYALGMVASYGDVRADFQIYADVQYSYVDNEAASKDGSAFAIGSLDFVTNVQISDRFRVLSETVLNISSSTGETVIGQERLWGMWIFSDQFYVKFGTEHGPVSRWNQLYHHGRWLETSINRPYLAKFEGGSGILPLHRTGIELGGRKYTSNGHFEYFATFSNGRGIQPSNKARASDEDNTKAVDLGIAYVPATVPDMRYGAALVLDRIPRDPASTNPDRMRSMDELIATANLEFPMGNFFVRTEFAWINHESRATSNAFTSHSGYLQAERRLGIWTPYVRFDYRSMDRGDPFNAPEDRDLDRWEQLIGLRYEPVENTAIKMEIGFGRAESRDSLGVVSEEDVVRIGVQLSWWL